MGSSKLICARCSNRGDKVKVFMLLKDSKTLISQLNAITPDQIFRAGMPICNTCRKMACKVELDNGKIY